jgi:anti-anti-sigma factor
MAELSDTAPAELTVDIEPGNVGDGPVVRLNGELDLSTVAILDAALGPLLRDPPARVSFDVGGLQFMDSSGLAVLVRCSARVPSVILLRPSTIVRRVIEAAGLADVLPMQP